MRELLKQEKAPESDEVKHWMWERYVFPFLFAVLTGWWIWARLLGH